jgi:A/G-specific adenine glycosylase
VIPTPSKAAASAATLPSDIPGASAALVRWFRASARALPWRTDMAGWKAADPLSVAEPAPAGSPGQRRDPYRTWIAEIMLQQTQVATVIAYYGRWMARFPDLASLAGAKEEDVLALWAGLGYYSRARNLLVTARSIMAAHGGSFPRTREGLLGLKGVGEYTAGAIASLAFNLPEPILDGNLVRVFSRLYGLGFLPDAAAGKAAYWELSRSWVGSGEPALINEGLMELGALVCTPRSPTCGQCPLADRCAARIAGTQEDFPPARKRKEAKAVRGYAVILRRGSEVLLYTPRKGELLAGLLTFPTFPLTGTPTIPALKKAWAKALPGLPIPAFKPRSAVVSHGITHHQFQLRLAAAELAPRKRGAKEEWPEGFAWMAADEVAGALVSSFPRKIWEAAAT